MLCSQVTFFATDFRCLHSTCLLCTLPDHDLEISTGQWATCGSRSSKYGWQEEDGKLAPVMLPQNAALAPVEVLQMIKCGCTSTRPCSTARCKCIVAQMSCSVFCKCHVGADCNNEHTKTLVPLENEEDM